MPVFRWGQAWDPFRDLEREMDRLLASMSQTFQGMRASQQYPAVNVYELPDEFRLTAELPGVKSDELEITVASGMLTLKGNRTAPPGIRDEQYRRQERPRGVWQRSIPLPDRIEEEGLSAEFHHGLLTIRLPKTAAIPARQIRVVDASVPAAEASPANGVVDGLALPQPPSDVAN